MKKIFLFFIISLILLTSGCTGKSAYDLAVENGFQGTIEDYLDSLKSDSISIRDIFDSLVEEGLYTNDQYANFISDYLNGYLESQNDLDIVVNNSFTSTVMIQAVSSNSASNGSGVIYKQDGNTSYIITNHHVIESGNSIAKTINVYLYGMEYAEYAISASCIGYSEEIDIAVLEITLDKTKYPIFNAATTCTSRVYVGDSIHVVGNALGAGLAATTGVVSMVNEHLYDDSDIRFMRTDAAINSGNSGGPVFNKYGELIGIVDLKLTNENVENMGYAIPIELAGAVADNIIDNNKLVKLSFGFDVEINASTLILDNTDNKYYIKETLSITSLSVISTAYKAGLRNGNQVLSISIDGILYEIERDYQVVDLSYVLRSGSEVVVSIYNGSSGTKEISFTI